MADTATQLVPETSSDSPLFIGKYTSSGAAVDVILGYVPDFVWLVNDSAATGETIAVFWTKGMGDADALNFTVVADNGSTGNTTPDYVGSGGVISEKNTGATIQTTDPVKVYANSGFTIAAGFQDDSDVIHIVAGRGFYKNFGDLGA